MDVLANKIALVTGGGSGICLAFVQILHEAGCRVLIADLGLTDEAKSWMNSLSSTHKARVCFHRTDVTKWRELTAAVHESRSTFGTTPDIYVPGAGIFEPNGPSFWKDNEADEDSRYKVLDINLVHPIKLTRIAVAELVQANKPGAIIYISSIAGQRSSIVTPLYTISKHGVNALIRGMAPLQELAGIRVAGVAPGTIDTPLYTPEARKFLDLSKDFLLPKEEVARAMFALLTKSEYSSGTILEVCDVDEDNWRRVEMLNDGGPRGPGSTTSNKAAAIEGIIQFLQIDSGAHGTSRKIASD